MILEACCKQSSITLSGGPEMNAVCNGTNCKQRTGSAFGISIYFKTDAVLQISGDTKIYDVWPKEQPHQQQRHFCPQCGTTLYWTISTLPNLIGVAGGCFTGTDMLEPTHSLNNTKKCHWIKFPEHWQYQG